LSGKDRAYKAGWLKLRGARRESEGSILPRKARKITRRREGTLLWSRRRGGKREGMPETANTPLEKKRDDSFVRLSVCAKCEPPQQDSAKVGTIGVRVR